jgi:hypothetical protein
VVASDSKWSGASTIQHAENAIANRSANQAGWAVKQAAHALTNKDTLLTAGVLTGAAVAEETIRRKTSIGRSLNRTLKIGRWHLF